MHGSCEPQEKSPNTDTLHFGSIWKKKNDAICNRELVIIWKVTPNMLLDPNRSLTSDFGTSGDSMMEMPTHTWILPEPLSNKIEG